MADIAASAPASGSSSPSAPASSTPASTTVSSGAESTGQPVVQSGEAPVVQSGEPPRERWNDILDNTRKKTRAEVEAEYQSKLAPYQDFERDPLSVVMSWLEKAEKHSIYGPVVRQHYASRHQANQPPIQQPEPQPDVPIVDERGNVTGKTYSADRLREWHGWNDAQHQAKLDARFGPIEQREQERQREADQRRLEQESATQASQTLTELRAQPYYKEHEADIREAFLAHPEWGSNVHRAYMHVMTNKILPGLSVAEAKATINSITQQGEASTVSPGTTTVGQPKFKSFGSAAKYFAEHPDEAAAMARR